MKLTLEPGTLNDLLIFTVVGLRKGKHAVISNPGDGWQIDRSRFEDDPDGIVTGPYESKEDALGCLQKEEDELTEMINRNRERSEAMGGASSSRL